MKKPLFIVFFVLILICNGFAQSTIHYTYDQLNRITSITYPDSSFIHYAYDPSGNRIVKELNNGTPVLHLKIFIEGIYSGSGQMQAVLYNNNLSENNTSADSITVQLHDTNNPDSIATTSSAILHTDGSAAIQFPISILNHSYYLVIHHRNSLETWSKYPIVFNSIITNYDFTSP